jgi:hypothetical protein
MKHFKFTFTQTQKAITGDACLKPLTHTLTFNILAVQKGQHR